MDLNDEEEEAIRNCLEFSTAVMLVTLNDISNAFTKQGLPALDEHDQERINRVLEFVVQWHTG